MTDPPATPKSIMIAPLVVLVSLLVTPYVTSINTTPIFLTTSDFILPVILALTLIISAPSGIGGGSLIVPILHIVGGFDMDDAVSLSTVTILGGGFANLIVNCTRFNPLTISSNSISSLSTSTSTKATMTWPLSRPLLPPPQTFNLLQPPLMIGALAGTFLHRLFPSDVTILLLVLILLFVGVGNLRKGVAAWMVETRVAERGSQVRLVDGESGRGRYGGGNAAASSSSDVVGKDVENNGMPYDLKSIITDETSKAENQLVEKPPFTTKRYRTLSDLKEDKPMQSPFIAKSSLQSAPSNEWINTMSTLLAQEYKPLLSSYTELFPLVCVLLPVLSAMTVIRSTFVCGSSEYILLSVLPLPLCFLLYFHARRRLLQTSDTQRKAGYIYLEGDIIWTKRSTVTVPATCLISGMIAGLFGIGGGIINAPLLLYLGMIPEAASATAAALVLLTSMISFLSYLSFNSVMFPHASYFFTIGFIATCLGGKTGGEIVRKYGRRSIIQISIGIVVLISCAVMAVGGVWDFINAESDGGGEVEVGFC